LGAAKNAGNACPGRLFATHLSAVRKEALFLLLFLRAAAAAACDCALYSSGLFPTLPVKRDSTGTSWLPDSSPVHGAFTRRGPWDLMVHGSLFLNRSDWRVDGDRQSKKSDVSSTDWLMAKASRDLGEKGKLLLRAMASLDPLTVGGGGYPLLFQTGESRKGRRLVDHQHPHDFLGELAAAVSYSVSSEDTFFLYVGLPGEPALGPPSYLHRPSAQGNPLAPLGHHWQDATHISFGVATAGWRSKNYKLEVSAFTGREPDEHRWDIDKPKFDSVSVRHSLNPIRDLAIQGSVGFIKSPDRLEPKDNETRANMSIIYNRALADKKNWATTLTYGGNAHVTRRVSPPHTHFQKAALLETEFFTPRWSVHGRLEYVEKFAWQLGLAALDRQAMVLVRAATLGASRAIFDSKNHHVAIGLQGTVYGSDIASRPLYGPAPYQINTFLHYRLGQI